MCITFGSRNLLWSSILAGTCAFAAILHAADEPPPDKWEQAIAKFEERDKKTPPPQGEVLFVGSSSVVGYKLQEWFPGKSYINRGFGGSQIADSTRHAHRLVTPCKPRLVVLYAGDNDLASGKTPERVAADYRDFVATVRAKLPDTKIIFIAIKPSLARWKNVEKVREANRLIAEFSQSQSGLVFLDVFMPMLGDDKLPRPELYVKDGLHMTPAGYKLWTALLTPLLGDGVAAAADGPADLIFHNGKIATVDAKFSLAQALAVRGERILKVGTNDEVLKSKGEKTRLVDLAGKLVLPGLIDSHTHPTGASMHEFDHPVPDIETMADLLKYIAARVAAAKEGEWITVRQVFITRLKEQRYPTKAELDSVAPKNPVVFSTGPDAALNSLALKLSGIDKDFVVSGTGYLEKDPETGEPTGILRSCSRYIKSSSPPGKATDKDRDERLTALFADYNSVGITAIADRNADSGSINRYLKLKESGALSLRIAISHAVDGAGKLESVQENIRKVAEHPLTRPDARLRIVGIKTFLDGGMLTGSAYMREPWGVSDIYSIRDPQYRGLLYIPQEQLNAIVKTTVESKLQFTAHSVGDGAVHALLDAYAETNKSLPVRPTRPCITHSNFMSREAVEKMVELGVVCDIQPAWLYLDARTLAAQFGNDRLRYFQPLKTIFDLGAVAGGGSDHMQKIGSLRSINPYNPFLGMSTTITRRGKWFDGQLHPEEALSREQALRFYTANNAYIMFLDREVGTLEAGKRADLIVVDRDFLTCPVESIAETQVLATYLDGQAVYERK